MRYIWQVGRPALQPNGSRASDVDLAPSYEARAVTSRPVSLMTDYCALPALGTLWQTDANDSFRSSVKLKIKNSYTTMQSTHQPESEGIQIYLEKHQSQQSGCHGRQLLEIGVSQLSGRKKERKKEIKNKRLACSLLPSSAVTTLREKVHTLLISWINKPPAERPNKQKLTERLS